MLLQLRLHWLYFIPCFHWMRLNNTTQLAFASKSDILVFRFFLFIEPFSCTTGYWGKAICSSFSEWIWGIVTLLAKFNIAFCLAETENILNLIISRDEKGGERRRGKQGLSSSLRLLCHVRDKAWDVQKISELSRNKFLSILYAHSIDVKNKKYTANFYCS